MVSPVYGTLGTDNVIDRVFPVVWFQNSGGPTWGPLEHLNLDPNWPSGFNSSMGTLCHDTDDHPDDYSPVWGNQKPTPLYIPPQWRRAFAALPADRAKTLRAARLPHKIAQHVADAATVATLEWEPAGKMKGFQRPVFVLEIGTEASTSSSTPPEESEANSSPNHSRPATATRSLNTPSAS